MHASSLRRYLIISVKVLILFMTIQMGRNALPSGLRSINARNSSSLAIPLSLTQPVAWQKIIVIRRFISLVYASGTEAKHGTSYSSQYPDSIRYEPVRCLSNTDL